MHPEHQPHPCVLPPDVRLAFPQLNVRVPKLQDPRTVNAAGKPRTPLTTDHLGEQERSPARGAGDCNTRINFSARNLNQNGGKTQSN